MARMYRSCVGWCTAKYSSIVILFVFGTIQSLFLLAQKLGREFYQYREKNIWLDTTPNMTC
jgi:hypothetical protein